MDVKDKLSINGVDYEYYSIDKANDQVAEDLLKLPFSLMVLLENLLRHLDNDTVKQQDIAAMGQWLVTKSSNSEIAYRPARVLMQDFTGVPAVVDLAAMRAKVMDENGDPDRINPMTPVDLVIDHSVQVDRFGNQNAMLDNVRIEMQRNQERYEFLKWGQKAFKNFRVVPPGMGICHQVNLEFLADVVFRNDKQVIYPDTVVGTDSHTTMVNGLGVLGWGVGGIEAEAAMLGQPISMLIPEVIGFRLEGCIPDGITATDVVLTITEKLRKRGVVGKFVEFFGDGLQSLSLADRATIANMCPEFGATVAFFPVDEKTLDYLELTGRNLDVIEAVEAYSKAQHLWFDANQPERTYTDVLSLDLSDIEPSLAGPKRPQDRVTLKTLPTTFAELAPAVDEKKEGQLKHGDVVIAAITSCTNTSNPSVMIAAGLLAKNALEKGLTRQPWVKSSLAPGSRVVTDYLEKTGLQTYLDELGFNTVGYGCTTCIGNSGPLPEEVSAAIDENDLLVCSVLSGNRNFEGRVHPQVKANWLASPPLVVAFSLLGHTRANIQNEPLGIGHGGHPVHLKDIWPSNDDIRSEMDKIDREMFRHSYSSVFDGDESWQSMATQSGSTYEWNKDSTYIQYPTFFVDGHVVGEDIADARVLAVFADSITTDHISPAGAIAKNSPAGSYLQEKGIDPINFNSYGSRRGNHEVMMRGTFANVRVKNEMVGGKEGGYTIHQPSGKEMFIFDAAHQYRDSKNPLVIFAGKEYGTGSSRDWAAKGTRLLGVRAVIAESFERIHRSNLIGMGVLPLQFVDGANRQTLNIKGDEAIAITGVQGMTEAGQPVNLVITRSNGQVEETILLCRVDTQNELRYYQAGGILHYVLSRL